MRKTFLALAALSLAGAAVAQVAPVDVAPRVMRNNMEFVDTGGVSAIGTTAGGIVIPPCLNGASTFRGAGLVGHFNGFHNAVVTAVWDKDEILAAQAAQIAAGGTGEMFFKFADSINLSTLAHTIKATVADPGVVRAFMEGKGPFPPPVAQLGNDILNVVQNGVEGSTIGHVFAPTSSRTDPVTLAQVISTVGTYRAPLGGGGGGGTLEACLGPTGQVRFINDGNNGDWATDCVANGWRAETISLGAGSVWDSALKAPNVGALNTFAANCALAFGAPTAGPLTIDNPIGVTFSQVDSANIEHRAHQFFFGGLGQGLQINSTNPAPGLPKLRLEIH